jgi:hypothetical protein
MGEGAFPLLSRLSAGEIDEATGEADASEVCPNCPVYATKLGYEPPLVSQAMTFAMAHEQRVKMGLRLGDQNALTPLQWSACHGLLRGRDRYDDWRNERDAKKRRNGGST